MYFIIRNFAHGFQKKAILTMKKKLVIFDLDGTLLNTIDDLAESANHALLALNFPTHDAATIRSFVGNGINKLLERALPEEARTEENLMRMRGEFIPYYDAHNADFSTPYSGITELLTCLQQQGIALAVASNKYQAATQKLVVHYFPNIRFVKVSGQKPEIPIKPDPAIVFDIIGETEFAKDEVLYVGDSGVDMQTALNAGIDAVGVSWGFRTKQELASYSPVGIIDNAEDLLKFIE